MTWFGKNKKNMLLISKHLLVLHVKSFVSALGQEIFMHFICITTLQ